MKQFKKSKTWFLFLVVCFVALAMIEKFHLGNVALGVGVGFMALCLVLALTKYFKELESKNW